MKKFILITYIIASSLLFVSCEDWLNLYPENAQVTDQYWRTKEDVESVIASGYVKLRNSVDKLFVWGEIRGNGIEILAALKDDNIKDAVKLRALDILPSNSYAKWGEMYQVINMSNSVIKYGAEVLKKDDSFSQAQLNSFLAEAYFLRSLSYFYLVRTFRDVPFILEPYVDDQEDFEIAKTTEKVILERIVADLTNSVASAKEFFPEVDNDNPMNTKGRATKWAIYALLADIYLWQGDYDKCIEMCDLIIDSKRVGLIEKWFTNFFPGNSNESIFEIQYSYSKGQTNGFSGWFDVSPKYGISIPMMYLFLETELLGDKRGLNASYLLSNLTIWKYAGVDYYNVTTAKRASNQNDQNFIIYRLADILLMKAEALVMKNNFEEAIEIVNRVRSRAGISTELNIGSTELDMLAIVLDERAREFVAEGKRWYDLLRVAKRDDYKYINYMIQEVITVVPLNSVSIVNSKLLDVNSHYLPIHKDEFKNNKLLEQNPYYSSLGN